MFMLLRRIHQAVVVIGCVAGQPGGDDDADGAGVRVRRAGREAALPGCRLLLAAPQTG